MAMVELSDETRRDLKVFKAQRDMTYDEAVQELLDGYEDGVE